MEKKQNVEEESSVVLKIDFLVPYTVKHHQIISFNTSTALHQNAKQAQKQADVVIQVERGNIFQLCNLWFTCLILLFICGQRYIYLDHVPSVKYGDRITELTSTYVSVPILNVVFAPDQLYDVLKKLTGKFCQVRE